MPATYSHKYTYEQIVGKGRNTWKKPEPAKSVDRRIFGYEVDSATFRKYNHQEYTIGHVFCDLPAIERWATDPDRAAKFPESAAEAKQIMEKIIAEITGKEQKNMREPKTAAGFIAALNDIYTETRNQYTAINDGVVKAEKQLERAQEKARGGDNIAQARLEVARADLREAQDECRNAYKQMMYGYNARVKELRAQFSAYLDEHYAASPDKLDTATMQLLNTGICKPSELARLVDRHHDNPTMLRIVGDYARKMREDNRRSMSAGDQSICTGVANAGFSAKDGSRELAIFDSAVSAAAYGLGKEYPHATRMHSYVPGWMDDFKNQIQNLTVTPAETGGAADTGDSGSNE